MTNEIIVIYTLFVNLITFLLKNLKKNMCLSFYVLFMQMTMLQFIRKYNHFLYLAKNYFFLLPNFIIKIIY